MKTKTINLYNYEELFDKDIKGALEFGKQNKKVVVVDN